MPETRRVARKNQLRRAFRHFYEPAVAFLSVWILSLFYTCALHVYFRNLYQTSLLVGFRLIILKRDANENFEIL